MISGANEKQLELANARANIVRKLDNTPTYESWLIIDTYIESLQQENQQLKIQISAREEECRKLESSWNELKEYIKKTKFKEFEKTFGKRYGKTFTQAEIIVCNMISYKMQELEGKSEQDDK